MTNLMKKNITPRLFAVSFLVCSLTAFAFINFGERLPVFVGKNVLPQGDSTKTQVQILPDVEFFKSVFKNGTRILPKISLSRNPML
jgi:hypothetical protein